MSFSLDDPRWLWLVLAGVACAAIGWRWFRAMPRVRRVPAVLARALLVAAVALTLAGLHAQRPADRVAVVGVIDVSRSVRSYAQFRSPGGGSTDSLDASLSLLRRAARERDADDPFGLVLFDGRSIAVATPGVGDPLARAVSLPETEGSDIAGAVRLARAMLPADARGRVVLISDGRPTGASLESIPPGPPIDVAPVVYRVDREVVVESFDLPPRSAQGAIMDGRIVVRSTAPIRGTVTVLRDGRPIDLTEGTPGEGVRVELDAGRHVVPVRFTLDDGRVHRYEAVFEPDRLRDNDGPAVLFNDTSTTNNRAAAYTITRSPGSILLVDGEGAGEQSVLARSLRAAEREVEVISPAAFPPDLLALEDHALIVLDNVAIDVLPQGAADRLNAYARTFGGGIIFVGGDRALTAGGWRGSAIEDALPVRLEIPDRVVMPETAVVFVLDRSGSMRNAVLGSSKSQQEVANAAAAAAIETLDPTDLVGVVAFSNNASVVVPLAPNDTPDATRTAVLGIRSDGGTNLALALEAARSQLAGVETKSKHVIVLSDGESQQSERLPTLASQLLTDGVRVTTIAVGDGADVATLRTVAEQGGGVLYRVTNPNTLPQVFIKAVRVLREPAVRSTPFAPITVDPDATVLAGVGEIPTLGGIVLSTRKDRATTPVVTPDDEPIVAYWPVELGRIAVVTTDAHQWSAAWQATPGFARFWTNLTAWTARAIEDAPGELRIAPSGDAAELVYEARDDTGAPLDGMDVAVSLYGPDGSERSVELTQTGPGRYEGRADNLPEGVLVAASKATSNGRPIAPSVAGVQVRTNAEDLALSSDEAGLQALAERTGGRVLDWENPQSLFAREGPPRIVRSALWPTLLIATMVLFLIDVGMRRLAWDRWVSSAREGTVAATAERASTLEQLKRGPRAEQPSVETNAGAERQRIERERVQRQMAEARQRASGRGTPEVKESASTKPEPEAEESGLLAAKRRAKKRFEES